MFLNEVETDNSPLTFLGKFCISFHVKVMFTTIPTPLRFSSVIGSLWSNVWGFCPEFASHLGSGAYPMRMISNKEEAAVPGFHGFLMFGWTMTSHGELFQGDHTYLCPYIWQYLGRRLANRASRPLFHNLTFNSLASMAKKCNASITLQPAMTFRKLLITIGNSNEYLWVKNRG